MGGVDVAGSATAGADTGGPVGGMVVLSATCERAALLGTTAGKARLLAIHIAWQFKEEYVA